LDRRDASEPLEVWLTRLLHDVLDEQAADVQTALSLEEGVDGLDLGREAAAGGTADDTPVWEEPLTVTFEDVLPSHEVSEPWQQLAAIDQMRWVLAQLSELSPPRRRAFTMHLLDGWEPEEIAMIQSRSAEEVHRDIQAVQQMLRTRLDAESETPRSGPVATGATR
jgi:DNA-directed RNA polymerase specialized sigma24 family protein